MSSNTQQVSTLFATAVQKYQAGEAAAAINLLGQVIALAPDHADAWMLLGNLSLRAGNVQSAERFLSHAVKAAPSSAEAHYNHAQALYALRDIERAKSAYERALQCRSDLVEAHLALGNIYQEQGQSDRAMAHMRNAIAIRPNYAGAHMNLGNALREARQLGEALAEGSKAVELDPASAVAHRNLALTQQESGLFEAALESFERALALNPDFKEAQSGRLFWLNYMPHWSAVNVAQAHREWGERFHNQIALHTPVPSHFDPDRKLRIGYVSGEFHAHPVGYFMLGVLASHDRNTFETYCYANGRRVDDLSHALRARSMHWRDISLESDEAAAQIIRRDNIDVLIELSGHTAYNRLRVFDHRPAPVQASWLGYVGSTGSPAIDYLLMDEGTLPPALSALANEKIIRLDQGRFCYTPPTYAPASVSPPCTRSEPVTFGSFNYLPKLGPDVVRVWSDVLKATPGSRLLLKWATLSDEGIQQRTLSAFHAHGIGADRLLLRGYSPHADMLAEYGDVDIALDPFPFCGGLTTCEALWMGVPVITWPQDHPPSRQTLSVLQQMGMPEFVAESEQHYVELARSLAGQPQQLIELRQQLRERMASSPVGDAKRFTASFEDALRRMWRDYGSRR